MTLSLARRAAHWPDRRALVDAATDTTYTYADLAGEAADMAGRLAAQGVAPGDRVVVLAENGAWQVTLLFGALRRGATLAPVSHRLAPDTVATLVDRIDPTLVVAGAAFADRVAGLDRPTTDVAAFRATEPAGDARETGPDASAGAGATDDPDAAGATDDPDAAGTTDGAEPLFLHTGGTTGVPKVVPITERQLEWNAITEATAWGLDEETVSVSVLPLFHTGGWNLLTLPTLYAGGTVVLPAAFDPGETLALVEEYGATQFFAVAAIYRAMADHPDFASTDFSSVEWFMSGGGPCPESVMAPYLERDQTFLQGYGLTEGGPNNLYFSAERAAREAKPDSVGRPFPDVEARLVGDDGDPVDGSGTGELEFRGPVTAERYLHAETGTFEGVPASTASGGSDGERRESSGEWVSTGDVARRDADGDYYIVGRTDNMFVSGGENVSPEVIEDVLERHEAVSAAAVTPVSHETWDQVPKAVVVGDADVETLEAHAREHLAGFQVPENWTLVDALPETGAGKLDREALAAEFGD